MGDGDGGWRWGVTAEGVDRVSRWGNKSVVKSTLVRVAKPRDYTKDD